MRIDETDAELIGDRLLVYLRDSSSDSIPRAFVHIGTPYPARRSMNDARNPIHKCRLGYSELNVYWHN